MCGSVEARSGLQPCGHGSEDSSERGKGSLLGVPGANQRVVFQDTSIMACVPHFLRPRDIWEHGLEVRFAVLLAMPQGGVSVRFGGGHAQRVSLLGCVASTPVGLETEDLDCLIALRPERLQPGVDRAGAFQRLHRESVPGSVACGSIPSCLASVAYGLVPLGTCIQIHLLLRGY